jgi:hypothetical protein
VEAAGHCDPSGHGRSSVAALIESGDVVADLLQADLDKAEAVLFEPDKVAAEVIGVGADGTGPGSEFRRQGIEPELGQLSIGPYAIVLCENLAIALVTDFFKRVLCEIALPLSVLCFGTGLAQ